MPIVNEDIIDLNEKYTLKFTEDADKYLNIKLKADLVEGRDFEFLDIDTWKIIKRAYQCHSVKRKIEESPDGKIVEVYFQKVSLVPMAMTMLKDIEQERTTKLTEVTLQFSKYATVEKLV